MYGIEPCDPALAVERHCEPAHRRPEPQDGGVEPRAADGPRADELVVAAKDELAAAQGGRPEQLDERIGGRWSPDDLALRRRRAPRLRDLVSRAFVGQEACRDLTDDLVPPEGAELTRAR